MTGLPGRNSLLEAAPEQAGADERTEQAEETRRWPVETVRLTSGRYNDLAQPRMGAVNTRFGRNSSPITAQGNSVRCFSPPSKRQKRAIRSASALPATG